MHRRGRWVSKLMLFLAAACAAGRAAGADYDFRDWLYAMPSVERVAQIVQQEYGADGARQDQAATHVARVLMLLRQTMALRTATESPMSAQRRQLMEVIDAEYQHAELAIGARLGGRKGSMSAAEARTFYESRRYEPCSTRACYLYWFKMQLEYYGAYDYRQKLFPLLFSCENSAIFLDLVQKNILQVPFPDTPALSGVLSRTAQAVTMPPPKACGALGLDIDGDGECFDWEARLIQLRSTPSLTACGQCTASNPADPIAQRADANRLCTICARNNLRVDPSKNGFACADDPTKACYRCRDGECGNHCKPSERKETKELKSGDLADLDVIAKKLKTAGNLFPAVTILDADVGVSVSGSKEYGEMCCGLCSVGKPSKSAYEKTTGGYRFDVSLKWGLRGLTGGDGRILPFTDDVRVLVAWSVGPFITIGGGLGNDVSQTSSDCEDRDCLTVAVTGSLGAKLDVGGSVRAGIDVFDPSACPGRRADLEARKLGNRTQRASKCFTGFNGALGELWATGGTGVTGEVAFSSSCPTANKCEVGIGKLAGKIFYRADVKLPFFTHTAEGVIVSGTLFEGGKASCLQ